MISVLQYRILANLMLPGLHVSNLLEILVHSS